MQPKILVFAGSSRTGAYSGKLAACAASALAKAGGDVTRIALADFPLPMMDEDLESAEGVPANALRLARLIAAHDGLLIATPEYNASIPPLLKNTIDWVSRVSKDGGRPLTPYKGGIAALCSSSPGVFAGVRALTHLRAVAVHVGLTVISEQCSIGRAHEAFADDGSLKDARSQASLDHVAAALVATCRAMRRTDPQG
jgi:chromate reductase, NAD(P)H dehydrogenase (quinone)